MTLSVETHQVYLSERAAQQAHGLIIAPHDAVLSAAYDSVERLPGPLLPPEATTAIVLNWAGTRPDPAFASADANHCYVPVSTPHNGDENKEGLRQRFDDVLEIPVWHWHEPGLSKAAVVRALLAKHRAGRDHLDSSDAKDLDYHIASGLKLILALAGPVAIHVHKPR